MGKKSLAFLIVFSFLFHFCGTINQNLQARKDLANCKYDLEKIELNKIDFDNGIIPKSVWFDVYLKITNTARNDVALDRVEAEIFLDEKKLTDLAHKNFVRIAPQNFAVEKIALEIGFNAISSAAQKKPENITVQATVYINILIGSFTLKTPFAVAVKKTFPIPYDLIEKEIQKKKNAAVDKLKDVKESAKSQLKKVF